jgi:signal transduction histidine kinase
MRGKALPSWMFLCAILVLSGVLGVLQYRWIGEVAVAARERMRGNLQSSLNRVNQDLNAEVSGAARALLPAGSPADPEEIEHGVIANLDRDTRAFRRLGIAVPRNGALALHVLDPARRAFAPAEWPLDWEPMRARLTTRLTAVQPLPLSLDDALIEAPIMRTPVGFGRPEIAWVIFELDLSYLRATVLPEILQRDLDIAGFQFEVVGKNGSHDRLARSADASIGLLDVAAIRAPGPGRGPGPTTFGRGPGPAAGRWVLYARHRAGSLEAAVSKVRNRNLAVTAGVLVLLIATAGALVRFTRRAQRLANQQMDFVAGISHELRTPLTVINTAGFNLRGKTSTNPAQVERYGALIQQESARLKDLVEQVLRYAGAGSGRVIREPEPVSVESVIHAAIAAGRAEIDSAHATVESSVEAGLPEILADPVALQHALGNLLSNATKYGLKDDGWIGVYASRGGNAAAPEVEIRVADHGPGIPAEEQEHIFDPFFRGQRAIQDQVHGTGLGLNLVKKIVEAHGGAIRVKSEPAKGAEFIVRLPALSGGRPA